ncbi:MAG: hypothetical protein ABSG32_12630 [Terriglobia bacterium]|jgi:hypothetical protein
MSTLSPVAHPRPLVAPGRLARLAEGPWLITAAVMLATFMEVLDTTVVNVSLTRIECAT